MKGKKLIVIMAIVILIFTIQASMALEEDNNFNLTQITDVDDVNVQIDDDKISIAQDNISEEISVNSQKESSNGGDVLGVSNNEDVLGRYIYITTPTMSELRSKITSAVAGDWIFLNGLTYTGSFNSISINKRLIICGGSSPTDTTRATLDLSQFSVAKQARFAISGNVEFRGIDFVNHNYSPTTGDESGRGSIMTVSNAITMTDCSFINNTVFQKSCLIEFFDAANGLSRIDNCDFINNTASLLISTKGTGMSFTANNNRFINNTGTINPVNTTNSLGLCIKVQASGSTFDNNIFINNRNAVHGAAYCVNARDVVITNNYIENNQASYGAGIECHLGYVSVYNTTFINNNASGSNSWDNSRSGTGGAISFIGPHNYLENCTFISNSAESYGGAMDIHSTSSQNAHWTTVVNSRFENNIAQKKFAGAVYIQGNNAKIENCNFTNNSAPTGGAIQLIGTDAQIIDSNFISNDAIMGGACYVEGNVATVSNSRFVNNTATHDLGSLIQDDSSKITSGGAMYVKSNDVSIIDSSFNDNIAYGNFSDNTGLGGALYILGQNPTFSNDNFTNNDAIQGGAVYIEGSNIDARIISLYNNTAVEGGAVYIKGNNINLDYFNATGNKAIQGGAIYIEGQNTDVTNSVFEQNNVTRDIDSIKPGAENLLTMGGAIYVEGNMVDIYDNNIFRRNIASGIYGNGGLGGAIAVNGNNTNIYDDNFTLNEAISGGAIYIKGTNATVKDMYFTTNNAIQGGAIFIEGANAGITNNTFYDNNATHDLSFPMSSELKNLPTRGGAISVSGSYANIVDNNFTYNAAVGQNPTGGHGGAIAIDGYHTTIYDNIFNDNEAIVGGALHITGTNTTIELVNFTSNNAIKGGAVYIKGVNTTIVNSEFKYNNATHNLTYSLTPEIYAFSTVGGAISIEGNNTELKNINFYNNTAIGVHLDGGYGGAAALNGHDTDIINVSFDGNQAIRGGAVFVNGTINTLNDTDFTNNAAIRGGAVFNSASSTTILNSKYVNNSATHNLRFYVNDILYNLTTMGGAVAIIGYSVNVTSCEFTNNTAYGIFEDGGLGGAIAVNGSDNYIFNSTFKDNEAIRGGAFYLEGNNTNILQSNFTDNDAVKGGAGYIDGKGSTIDDSNFIDNDARHDLRFVLSDVLKNVTTAGGAIFIRGDDVNVSSSNFKDNDAKATNENVTRGGGAFYIEGNNANISNSYFSNNTALKGGAVFITGNHTQIYDSEFIKNSVTNFTANEGFGGAVYLENAHDSDFTKSKFINNTASLNGGAIDWHQGATNGQIVDCVFENNTAGSNAGAIFWFGTGGIIQGSNFTNNQANGTVVSARGNYGDGGAIMWTGSDGTIDNCNFINNTATQRGGAVFLRGVEGYATCDNNTFKNSHFEDNAAGTNGGAIDWYQGATDGLIENSTFEHNVANRSAGAVFWNGNVGAIKGSNFTNNYVTGTNINPENNNTGNGGAIMWLGSDGLVDDCIFINNTAPRLGGAVYLEASSFGSAHNTTFSNSHFENNTAGINGGAINWHEGATDGLIENSSFVNNTAKANGGAVFWYGDNGYILNSNFTNNRALGKVNGTHVDTGCGGAVIWTGSNGTVDNCIFINNSADKNGGAVYLRNLTENGCDNTTFKNSHFENNTAGRNGGAIDWHKGATNGRIEDSTLVNNSARANGGAIYWYGNNGNIIGSNFTDNRALGEVNGTFGVNTGCGGAVIWTGSNGTVDDCNFINNYANQSGGALYIRELFNDECDNTTFTNSHFENNTAGINGGAIDWHEGATNGKIENSTFVNNSAKANGGAVFWFGTNGTISGSNFTDNKALGTAIGTYGRSGDGGAIIWTGSNGLVDDCNFANNTAAYRGGAVFLDGIDEDVCDNTTFSNSHFENNVAGTNGGAIDWHEGATNGKIENSTFLNNTANRAGGAVYWNGLNGTIVGSNFTNNRATGINKTEQGKGGDGGAVIWIGSNGLVDDCDFINNTAARNGGAVFLESYQDVSCNNNTFRNSHFENNTADINGGAIDWSAGATNGAIVDSSFVNNSAKANGGAVFWYGTNGTINGSNFTNNRALGTATGTHGDSGEGGAVIWTGSNGLVDDCIFTNNTAAKNGGAVYLRNSTDENCSNTVFSNSHFENNTAGINGGAIDWHEGATDGKILNSSFVNNTAKANGGAVFWFGTNGTINGSNFTNNRALGTATGTYGRSGEGGAVIWTGSNGIISDSTFVNNTAAQSGGAVYLDEITEGGCNNVSFLNSKFINNTASIEGGAIDWNDGATNGRVENSVFENNNATEGGAISWTGHYGVIVDSNFTDNYASENGGAVSWSGIHGKIDSSRFVGNNASFGGAVYLENCTHGEDTNVTIRDSYFENNAAVEDGGAINWLLGTNATITGDTFVNNSAKRGGAIFINGTEGKVNDSNFTDNEAAFGGAIYINGEKTLVEDSKFYNNTAITSSDYNEEGNPLSIAKDGFGGAVFVAANNAEIKSSEFNDNKACNGSAVYNNASGTKLTEDKFIKNQAWSYNVDLNATPNVTFYGLSLDINISNYTGGDNIINGIYNAKGSNDITFNDVEYIINDDESDVQSISGNPVIGAENSEDGTKLYQDSLERYQKFVVEITNDETGKLVYNETVQTDLYGNNSFELTDRLRPGNYTVKAYHNEDRNYRLIKTSATFEIRDYVDINITKTVSKDIIILGDNVTFVVTVSNAGNGTNATNIVINDTLPAGLEYLDVKASKGNYDRTTNKWTIEELANGTSATLTLVFKTTQLGEFNNTVNATCNEQEWNYTNNNATVFYEVVLFNLTINKTHEVTGNISVNDDITFTVNITNNAVVDATNLIIYDVVPAGFKFVDTTATGYDEKTGLLNIDLLEAGESYIFTITLKAMTNGTLTNHVNVTCAENTTVVKSSASINVTPVVNLTVTKVAEFDDAIVGDLISYYITVTNNGPSNATDIQVTDLLNVTLLDETGSDYGEFTRGDLVDNIRQLTATIPFLANGTSKTYVIKVKIKALGSVINKVNVTCKQNDTIKSAEAFINVYNVDLRINKTVDKDSVPVQGLLNFTITVKNHSNHGFAATNINITDLIGEEFEIIDTNGTPTRNGNLLIWKISKLECEESYSVWVQVRAKTNGTFVNTAKTNCTEEGALEDSSVTVKVTPVVSLAINKTSNITAGSVVSAGELVKFTINVTNNGISNATGVQIRDLVPAGFKFNDTSDDRYDPQEGLLTIPLIKPKESYVVTITLKVVGDGTLTNIANVTCAENDTVVQNTSSIKAVPLIITVNKTANATLVANNTLVNFTIVVNNTGIIKATNVTVTDILPNGLVFDHASIDVEQSGQQISWKIAELPVGTPMTFWIVAKTSSIGTLTNWVNVTCDENETASRNKSTVKVDPVILTINKTANVTVVGNDTLVKFTIVVNNTGTVNATYVQVNDALPNGLTFVSASDEDYIENEGVYSWIIDKLVVGTPVTLEITARTNSVGNWTNYVNVFSNENDTVMEDTFKVDVRSVNLTVVKTADVVLMGNNSLVNFTITVKNEGTVNATEVIIKDALPDELTFVNATKGYELVDGAYVWNITLNAGNETKFWIVARTNSVGEWTNRVNVTAKENKTVISDDIAVKVLPVTLTVNKTANVTVVGNNTLVNFTITVNNTGVMNATGVVVKDVVPNGFVIISASAGNTTDNQKVSWAVDRFDVGEVKTFWIVARSNATGIWTNEVKVNSTENATVLTSQSTVDVRPVTYTVNKTANVTVIGNNTLVKFTIVVNNTGVMNATGVTINDILPDEFKFVSASEGNTTDGQKVSWTIDRFDVGDVKTFWIIARTAAVGPTTNVVTVFSNENKTVSTDNADVNIAEINATLNKTANLTVIANNTLVNFTIVLNHTSIVNATNVTVCDVLPNGFVFVNATGVYTRNGQLIKWHFDTVTPGEVIELMVTARSNATGKWNNTVKVSCNENSTIISDNATVDVLSVNATIIKTANVTAVGNNTLVNFTIGVNYTALVNATNVTICDVLPDGFTFVDASEGYNRTGQKVEWYFDTLNKGTYEFWIVARSNKLGKWNNTVSASCNENSTIIGDNATVDVLAVNASINKKANVTLIGNNTLVKFTIAVNYTSVVNATNVTIRDVLPEGFAFVSATGSPDRNRQEIKWYFDTLTKGYFELEIVARSNDTGIWKNVVSASCNENSTIICGNATVEVAPVNITVIKEVDAQAIDVLGLVNFTITVTNTGKINATDVSFTDMMDLSVFEIKDHNGTFEKYGDELVFDIGSLNVGETYRVWIQAKALTNGTYANVVNVTSFENKTAGSDNVSVKVIPIVNLTVVKTVNFEKIGLNDYVVFTINVTNHGPSNATNVNITDVLPIGLEYYDSSSGHYVYGDEFIVPLIEPGESFVFTITALAAEEGNWTNVVSVTCAENDTVKQSDASVEVVVVNVTAEKYPDFEIVGNNSLVNFTIEVKNNDIFNVSYLFVYDILPDGFEFVNATEGYYQEENMIFWDIDRLAKQSGIKLWIVVKTTKVDNLTNEVEIYYNENNYMVYTNSTIEVVPVNLTISKTAESAGDVYVNGNVTFIINVTNNARAAATNVTVSDVVPEGFEFISSNATGYDSKTGSLTIPVIGSGESYVFAITLKVMTNGTLTNTVNVTCNENDTVVSTSEDVNAVYDVKLTVEKVADSDDATIGDVITFTITVTNNGISNATNIRVSDILTEGLALVEGELEQVIEFLASGDSVSIVVKARTTANGTYMNTVDVSCDENDTVVSANASVHVYNTDIKINKVADVTVTEVNGLVNFTISVKNHGKSNATNIHITDELDAGFEFVESSGEYTFDGKTIMWNIPKMANETTVTVWVVVKALRNGTFVNVAHANCSEEETVKNSTVSINVTPVVDLTVNKTITAENVKVGGEITFTITVTNNGPSNATGVKITDIVPEGFEFVNASTADYDSETGLLTVELIESGESYVFNITLKAITKGTLTNTVNVTCNENDTVVSSSVDVESVYDVNLTVIKSVDSDDAGIEDIVTFTITITNNGVSNATDIKVTDVLPEGLTLVEGELEQVIEFLASGDSVSIVIKVQTTTNGTYVNSVTVSCSENDTVVSANASVRVYNPDLKITKTADVNVTEVYGLVNFTIVVRNHGDANATNVHISDELGSEFEFVDASGDYRLNGQTVVWTVPSIANETSYTVWIVVKVLRNGTLVNVAHVNCSEERTVKNTTASVNVTPVVNLTVEKVVDSDDATIGDIVNFTITVTNNGPSDATDIKLIDVIPDGFEFVDASTGDYDSRTGLLTIPVIKSGESYAFTITLKVLTIGTLTNTVNVTCSENETVESANVSVHVYNTDLKINKTSNVTVVNVNGLLNFTIVVRNHGAANATNVRISDELDSAFEFVDASGDYTINGKTVVWTIPKLTSEATSTVWIVVKVLSKGTFENVAHVNCSEEVTVKNSTVAFEVLQPNMTVSATADDEYVYSGNQTSFTIKITNNGESVLNGITLTGSIPEGLIYDRFTGSNWTYDGEKFHYAGSLAVGESIDLIIVTNTTKSGEFTLDVTAASDETGNCSDSASVLVYTPDLTVRVISNNPRAVVGQSVSFTVVVTNIGDCDLTGVYVVNNFPQGLIYTGYDGESWNKLAEGLLGALMPSWTQDGDKFTYSGILRVGESANYTIYFNTTKEGVFTPEAVASSDLTSGAYSNNTTVVVGAKIEVKQVIDKTKVEVGEKVVITVTVTNAGGCDLGDVFVIENVPEGLKYQGFTGKGWTKVGNKFIYSGVLAVGESASFSMEFIATKEGNVTNSISAGSNMTEEIDDDVHVEVVNKTTPHPDPHPDPSPEPDYNKTSKDSHKYEAVVMRETGNPIILLLLVIFALIPLKRRKH